MNKIISKPYYIYKSVIILVSLLLLTSPLSPLPSAHAASVSLSISPAILQIRATPPADVRAPISIENNSDESVDITIGLKLFKDSSKQNGEIEYLGVNDTGSGPDKNIFQKIQVVDEGFSRDTLALGPKQKKNLQLRINLPKDEIASDYYFSVVFIGSPQSADRPKSSQDTDKNTVSVTDTAIAMNVLLAIGPKSESQGYIDEFSAPWYLDSGPVPFTLKVKNTGTHFISAKSVVLIKNMFGQTVGRIDIPTTNILANSTRSLISTPTESTANKNSQIPAPRSLGEVGSPPKVLWSEKFLLGFYTADLSFAISEKGPLYERTVHFVAFPAKLLLGLIIASIILLIIYLRVKRKLKEE